ncbi:MAG: hypothetical protein ABSC53_13395 [Bacteroidota bacterium]
MTQHELCDEILKLCLSKMQLRQNFSIYQWCSAKGADLNESTSALNTLCHNSPPYLSAVGERYVLTPDGEYFVNSGGYAGKAEREAKEQLAKEEEKKLIKAVNQSVLDTNSSVRSTHTFQKTTARITLFVAICSVLISFFTFLKECSPSQTKVPTQTQSQREIDSLKSLIKEATSQDTLREKHP